MQTLVADPRSELTETIVLDALSLAHGPKVRWGVDVLDTTDKPVDDETIPAVDGEVSWSYRPPDGTTGRGTGAAEVRRRARLTLVGDVTVDLVARRFRIWMELQASTGEWVRWHLGVFVATNPAIEDDGILVRRPVQLADKTYRWGQRFLTDPVTVAAGTNLIDWVKARLTSVFGETSFAISASSVVLDEARVFEAGMSELAVMNALLEAAGHDALTATENGRPRSVPLSDLAGKGPERTYGPGSGKVVTAGSVEPLLPTLPNVVRFVARQGPSLPEEGNGITTRSNQSTGPASIDSRGEEVQITVDVEAENQTELEAIADAECQRYFAGGGLRAQLHVGLCPAHSDRDVVEIVKPRLGLSGDWLVTSWSLPLGPIESESSVLMPVTCEARVVAS